MIKTAKPVMRRSVKLAVVINCKTCPHVRVKSTPGAGCADDYHCALTLRLIVGYVESSREGPQDHTFPDWCPLTESSVLVKE